LLRLNPSTNLSTPISPPQRALNHRVPRYRSLALRACAQIWHARSLCLSCRRPLACRLLVSQSPVARIDKDARAPFHGRKLCCLSPAEIDTLLEQIGGKGGLRDSAGASRAAAAIHRQALQGDSRAPRARRGNSSEPPQEGPIETRRSRPRSRCCASDQKAADPLISPKSGIAARERVVHVGPAREDQGERCDGLSTRNGTFQAKTKLALQGAVSGLWGRNGPGAAPRPGAAAVGSTPLPT
jgi:hypothetical protein